MLRPPALFSYGYYLAVTDFLYARQNFFEGLEKERENNNTGSVSEFSSEEEMEEVDEAAVDLWRQKQLA